MSTGKPLWYEQTVKFLQSYHKCVSREESLKEEVEDIQPIKASKYSAVAIKQSGISDNTVLSMGKHLDDEFIYKQSRFVHVVTDELLLSLRPIEQVILRERFIEGKKNVQVMKILEKDFGAMCGSTYAKVRDQAITRIALACGFKKRDDY